MPDINPFAAPAAPVADVGVSEARTARLKTERYLFGFFVGLQLVAALLYWHLYYELTRTGAVSLLALIATVIGSLCLYGATLFIVAGRPRGIIGFIFAALLLGVSLRGWGPGNAIGWVPMYGVLLSGYGFYMVRRLRGAL
jgi:hypothetical protein